MAPKKTKKRKFWHPHMIRDESSSNDSSYSIPTNTHSSERDQSTTPNKIKKFTHPHMIIEEDSTESETNDLDQDDQIGGQVSPTGVSANRISSPIAGPSNLQIETTPVQSSIQQTTSDELLSPIAGPSKNTRDPIAGPSRNQDTNEETGTAQSTADDSGWFEEETKVFENEDFSVFIQKQDHQRQKVFRLDDHLFVTRIKLKNHKKPPLLSSIRDIIEQTMTVMVNDLKNHYNPQESNLIYVTLKQPGNSSKHSCEFFKSKFKDSSCCNL